MEKKNVLHDEMILKRDEVFSGFNFDSFCFGIQVGHSNR